MGLADITVAKKKARRKKPSPTQKPSLWQKYSPEKQPRKARRAVARGQARGLGVVETYGSKGGGRGARQAAKAGLTPTRTKAKDIKPWEKTLMDLEGREYAPTEGQAFRSQAGDFRTGFEKGLGLVTGTDPQAKLADNLKGIALTLGAGGLPAATGTRAAVRAAAAAKTATRTEEAVSAGTRAAKVAKGAKGAAKGAGKKAPKTKPTPKKKPTPKLKDKANVNIRAENLGSRAVNRYSATERRLRRARRSEKAVRNVTNPALAVPGTSEKGRAFIEGHLEANPAKAAVTTAQALPATFAFGATVAADTIEAAKTGSTAPLKGTLSEAKGAVTQLAPLVSGDKEQVKAAIENDVGYIMAPLLPKGVNVANRLKVRVPIEKLPGMSPTSVVKRAKRAKGPNKGQAASQIVTQRGGRKRTAQIFSGHSHEAGVRTSHAIGRIDKPARKIKGKRNLKNLRKDIAGEDVLETLVRYGVPRKNAHAELRKVLRSLSPEKSEAINVRSVMAYIEEHPSILKDPNVWKMVDQARKEIRPHETSRTAKLRGQAEVLSLRFPEGEGPPRLDEIIPPERAVPMGARAHTKAETRPEAVKDYKAKGKNVKELRDKARKAQEDARVLRAEVKQRAIALRKRQRAADAKTSKAPKTGVKFMEVKGPNKGSALRPEENVLSERRAILWYPSRADTNAVNADDFTWGNRELFISPKGWTHIELEQHLMKKGVIDPRGNVAPTRGNIERGRFVWQDEDAGRVDGGALAEAEIKRRYPDVELAGHGKPRPGYGHAQGVLDKLNEQKRMSLLRPGRDVQPASGSPRLVEDPVLNRKLDQLLDLEANVRGYHAEMRGKQADIHALGKELNPYRPGDKPPSKRARRKDWDKPLVDEFEQKVIARRKEAGWEEPMWTAEPRHSTDPTMRAGNYVGPSAVHPKTGKSARTDTAARDYGGFLAKTIRAPYVRKGLARGVRQFVDERSIPKPVNGKMKRAVSDVELAELHRKGLFDPRSEVAIGKRQIGIHLKDEDFDLDGFHSDITRQVNEEFDRNSLTPGESYMIAKREDGLEFMDQVDPKGSRVEAITGPFGMGTSRIVLNSPAWLAAQTVATGAVATAAHAFNPYVFGRAAWTAERLRAIDPPAYERHLARAGGAGPSVDTPHSHRLSNDPITKTRFRRGLNSTFIGRRIDEVFTQRTFALLDRWQTGKWRTAAHVAYLKKAANKSERARLAKNIAPKKFQPYLAEQAKLAEALKGKNRVEQLQWWDQNPRKMDSITQKMRDTQGDWHTYSRFEKEFAGLFIFYPFIRMSLTWPTRFARHHPLVSESLYLLAQSSNKELEQFFNDDDMAFLEYADAVVHGGPDGAVSADIPSARRFATPALNAVTEAVGGANSAGLFRALNPALAAPIYAVGHIDPFTGDHTDESVAQSLKDQLIGMPPAFRALGIGKPEPSGISQTLEENDPERKYRSLLNPFDARPAEAALKHKEIIDNLKASAKIKSEIGQFMALVESEGEAEAIRILKEDVASGKALGKESPPDPTGDAEFDRLSDIYYAIKYGTEKKRKAKRTSTGDSIFGGGGGGGGSIFSGGSGGSGGSIFGGGGGSGGSIFK